MRQIRQRIRFRLRRHSATRGIYYMVDMLGDPTHEPGLGGIAEYEIPRSLQGRLRPSQDARLETPVDCFAGNRRSQKAQSDDQAALLDRETQSRALLFLT